MLCLRGLFWGILLLGCRLTAQVPSLYFDRLTTQNGLSHNKVNCIIQDSRGFTWFGTDDGLNRYDGHQCVVFRHQPGNPASISGNIINGIVEDEQGVLWIATGDGGLTRYDYRQSPKQQFKQYKQSPTDTSSIPVNIINAILLDPYGYLWLATSGYSVLRFDRVKEKFEKPVLYGTTTALDLCLGKNDTLWVGREGGGILKVNAHDLSNEMDERYTELYDVTLPHAAVTALFSDEDNRIWLGSWDKVLYRCNPDDGSEEVFRQTSSPFSFKNDEIGCFASDAQGRLWMGGRHAGLQIYDKRSGRFYNYQYDPSKEGTIADNNVNCVYIDKNDIVWVATNKGVSIHHSTQQQFAQTFLPGSKTGSNTTIYDFYKQDNDLLIGTSEGLYIRRDADQSFLYKPIRYKGTKLQVTKFFKDEDGTFYIGTDYSLFKFDLHSHNITLLPNTEKDQVMNKIIESRVVSVVRDTIEGRPVLLVAPYGHYLAYYDLQQQQWVSRRDTIKKIIPTFNLKDNLIRKLYKARNGHLWLATVKHGLGAWVKNSLPRVEHFYNDPGETRTISNNNVYDMIEDDLGNLWVSTFGGGLQYFNPRLQQFTHIPATNNLLEGLQTDIRGSVWMISNGNLHQYDPLRKSYSSYDLPDIDKSGGVKGYIYKDRRGHLYAAGFDYFIEFDPLAVKEVRRMPQVFFTDLRIFNQSYSHLLLKDKIALNYTQNYFTIEFAAPDFSAGSTVQYSYMLEGRDKEWIDLGTYNFKEFSNLDGGEYILKVRATNKAGIWSNDAAAIRLVIIPPFWKTWWFYALVALAVSLIIYAVYRYRINELVKRQTIRNKIAQDLHDNVGSTLSSISVYSQVAKIYNEQERPGDLQQTLEKISTTSGEMISEMNDIVWAINPRNDNMDTILLRMESYARPLLASQGIGFYFEVDALLKQVNLEMTRRKNFYLIFKETVNNALKYADCKNLWVRITVKYHQVELTIKDDGKGFDLVKAAIHASQSLSGNGLRNMEMRAAEMNGTLTINTEPGKGTTIRLHFPAG